MKLKYFLLFLYSLAILQLADYVFYSANLSQINNRFVFGIFGNNILAIIIAIFLLIILYVIIPKTKAVLILFGLLSASAISNIIDRFLYRGVVDYLKFWIVPAFNLADIIIVISVVLIFLQILKKPQLRT